MISMKIFDSSAIIALTTELNDPAPLIHLKNIGYKLTIPDGVYRELTKPNTRNKVNSLISQQIFEIANIPIDQEDIEELKSEFPNLHKGEIEVLIIGKMFLEQKKDFCCIIDETPGRNSAKELNLPFHGILGILSKLKDKDIIDNDKHKKYLDDLEREGFWFKRNH